jgi:hypothetical protein
MVGIVIGLTGGWFELAVISGWVAILSFAAAFLAAMWVLPTSVEFGEFKTFRDLSKAIALGAQN